MNFNVQKSLISRMYDIEKKVKFSMPKDILYLNTEHFQRIVLIIVYIGFVLLTHEDGTFRYPSWY